MKKYRLKVGSPWGKKGKVVKLPNELSILENGIVFRRSPDEFPEIFELVIEPSDEEWLAEWLSKEEFQELRWFDTRLRLAKSLIKHGFDIKKLRGES